MLDRAKILEWDADGSPRRMVGTHLPMVDTHLDVTARTGSEALRRQRDLLNQTQRVAGVWEHNLDTDIISWSEETYRITDWPPDKPIHLESVLDLFLLEARFQLRAAIQAAFEEGTPYDLKLPLVTLKGTRRWVRAVGAAVY